MSTIRKIITAAITALTLGATVAATTPAQAAYGRNAAFFGGLAVGALAVGALSSNSYAAPYYSTGCYVERRAVTNAWGDVVGFRRVRICD